MISASKKRLAESQSVILISRKLETSRRRVRKMRCIWYRTFDSSLVRFRALDYSLSSCLMERIKGSVSATSLELSSVR